VYVKWLRGTRRDGSALAVAALLVSVLSVLSMTAVDYYLSLSTYQSDLAGDDRAFYTAEAGRADAYAHIAANPAQLSYDSGLKQLRDYAGVIVGEYSYLITDVTPAMGNSRRQVRVSAYWPAESDARATHTNRFYIEQDAGIWQVVAFLEERP
jgi:hypothetical protein